MTEQEIRSDHAADLYNQAEGTLQHDGPGQNTAGRMEEALRVREQSYRTLTENLPVIVYRVNAREKEGMRFFNNMLVTLTGYTEEELIGGEVCSINPLIVAEDRDRIIAEVNAAIKDNRSFSVEYRITHKDGTPRFFIERGRPIFDNDKLHYIDGIIQDVTTSKLAENALRESEAKYRYLTSKMKDVIWTLDMNFRMVYVSPSIEKALGFTPEEHMARNIHEQVTPASLSIIEEVIARELALERASQADPERMIHLELEYYHKDGHIRWFENVISGIRNDQGILTGVYGVARDITDRKKVEEALRESEERYRRITRAVTDYIYTVRIEEGRPMETSHGPGCIAVTGYSTEEFAADPFLWIKMVVPEDQLLVQDQAKRILSGAETPVIEHRIIRKDGAERWIRNTPVSHRDEEGRLVSYDGLVQDITENKRAEEEKKILEERLRHADKMESIGTLAGGIAHDFNNLLMGIQGCASLTLLELDPSHPHYERLKRIEEQVESGADLTKQLLGFARRGRYEVKSADMNDILEKCSSMFGRTKKEISIYRKYGKNLWSVEADRGQMEQVFMNLYVNAWQAMPGGGELYLETENVLFNDEQAIPFSVRPGKYVKISVTDTGTGMDEKTRERIFDPFFTTKRMGRGTGLGLATVYGIIKGHGGTINVYSEPGQGTTFNIYLPASEREVAVEKTEIGAVAKGTETILLVDDEKMVLEVSREMLESLGYHVYTAGSGQEALAVYMEKRNEIDLVILDMIMPGISGGETFDHLREINSSVRVLLSSGYSIDGEAKHILIRGCNGFIQKPYCLEMLSKKIRDMIDKNGK